MAGDQSFLGSLLPWFDDAINGIVDALKKKGVNADASVISSVVQPMISAAATSKLLEDSSSTWLDRIKAWFSSKVLGDADKRMRQNLDALVQVGAIPKDSADSLYSLIKGHPVMGTAAVSILPILVAIMFAVGTISSVRQLENQNIQKTLRPGLPDVGSIIGAGFIDNTTIDRIKDVMARNGIQDSDMELLWKGQYATYSPDIVRDLFLRKVFSIDQVYIRLREMRYTDKRIAEMVQTWQLIPPVTDIIRMAVREAFNDQQVQFLGLDSAFPDAVKEWGEKQGLSEFWQRQYWRAHWELPSRSEGAEMLHRGLISKEDYDALLKALDYSPTWRDNLREIAYNVLTRVDLRRLYELGLVDDDSLEKHILAQGYSPDDTKLLVRLTQIEYNEEYRNLTSAEVVKQYLTGITSEEDARGTLKEMGYTEGRINTMIALARYQRNYAGQTARVEALHKLYLTGQMQGAEVVSELSAYNIDTRRIEELLDLWALEVKAGLKLPRFQELTSWLQHGIITADTFRKEMLRSGYSPEHIEMYIAAAGFAARTAAEKAAASNSKQPTAPAPTPPPAAHLLTRADLDKLYLAGTIDETRYRQGLSDLDYIAADIDLLVADMNRRIAEAAAKRAGG